MSPDHHDDVPVWGDEPSADEPEAEALEGVEEEAVVWPQAPEGFRSGYVALIGRPNVGKSSLVNALLGERLAPTSPVPQTTRRRLLGILTTDQAQIVFVDTPGLHEAKLAISQMMLQDARASLVDADLVLLVLDASREPGEEDRLAYSYAKGAEAPRLLLLNKVDLLTEERPEYDFRAAHREAWPGETFHETSALTEQGLPELLETIVAGLPEGPPYFPEDQVSDAMEREIAAELIREAALGRLSEELPHAVAVRVDEWKERDNGLIYLHAYLYVERDSQKGMVIGRGGRMLRGIGSEARTKLEGWLGRRVYLDLEVKVLRGWRKNPRMLRFLGFQAQRR